MNVIILYNPRSTDSPKKPLPLSLLAVASRLEEDVRIVDGNIEPDPVARILSFADEQAPTAIGMTVMPGPQLQVAIPHGRQIKAALPSVPIVWGGYFASQHGATCLKDESIDFCIRGQGEDALPALASILRHGGDLSSIAGLSWQQNGTIRTNPTRTLVPLDTFPDWPYDRVPVDRYMHSHYLGNRVAAHQTSYGCPFACGFCAIVEIAQQRWVSQSPARVESVVRYFKEKHGADAMQFHDMDFFVSEPRAREIAERMRPLGMSWWALGRIDELMRYSDDTMAALRDSGLKMVFCGAEAGDDETLARMNKGGTASANQTIDLARRLKTYDIVPEYSFVLGSPPDPHADIESTMAFVRKVKEANPETELILYMYTPVPAAGGLTEEAAKMGFGYPDTLDAWISGDWRAFALRRDPPNPWLDKSLKRRVHEFESVMNAYYPTVTDLRLSGTRRKVLRAMAGWRYRTETYAHPWELKAFHRFVGYRRPETAGF
jgi:radical SAM superfamily enzyme YgiQ (UPF0313 family)